ncbi:protein FAF-like, chloroplastic [Durio zibethinus]|uniref:Protein FAF-like, chloroplastic n=1 Tax=Durio zibethinus TaxID=66656 RepID=A0A6P5ZV71_DURZI|nr:protein FAF-like, chloroplastic [Durio zibethinus]
MSAPLSKSLCLSSALNINEEAMVTEKKGIVSILGSDTERPTEAASLRRTLSADMSSNKWLTQHGFSPLKKIASSKDFPVSTTDSSSEEEEDYEERKVTEARGQFDIWTSIQEENKKKELEKPGQFDIWSLIISQKAQEDPSKPVPPPYIHPLVKRSASSLSEKSLQICTESLGSETGSDGFSSYPPSESGDMEEDKEEDQELQQQKQERVALLSSYDVDKPRTVKYNYDVVKKSPHRSFPPPIPYLSCTDGASVRMKTHRDNGRLVLQAVSVSSQNNFLAQRQDGRLVLTFANTCTSSEAESKVNEVMNAEEVEKVEELEEEFESYGEEEKESEIDIDEEEEDEEEIDEIEEVEDRYSEMEKGPKLSSGAMNVHRLALIMNKPIWLANRNPTWPNNFDEIVKFGEERGEKVEPTSPPPLAQSLPPRTLVARLIPSPPSTAAAPAAAGAAASFNAYEYYWKRPNQPMSKAAILNPLALQSPPLKDNSNKQLVLSKNLMANDQQQLLVLRGNNGDYFVPLLRGCKESRRSLLFLEPYCIATS